LRVIAVGIKGKHKSVLPCLRNLKQQSLEHVGLYLATCHLVGEAVVLNKAGPTLHLFGLCNLREFEANFSGNDSRVAGESFKQRRVQTAHNLKLLDKLQVLLRFRFAKLLYFLVGFDSAEELVQEDIVVDGLQPEGF
jgi:hypothetical protein